MAQPGRTIPHDWSIEGEFNPDHPAGTGGGALPGGIGWYRKSFSLLASVKDKLVFIDFDGIYRNSEVWINGHYLGKRPNGYISFRYDLTPYLHDGSEKNLIAVKVDNSQQPNSRWYSGSGIYRNVWLVAVNKIHIDHWGTYITTPEISDDAARISIETRIKNNSDSPVQFEFKHRSLMQHQQLKMLYPPWQVCIRGRQRKYISRYRCQNRNYGP